MRRVLLKNCLVMLRARVFLSLIRQRGIPALRLAVPMLKVSQLCWTTRRCGFPPPGCSSRRIPMCLRGKQGYLTEAAKRRGIAIIAQAVSPLSFLLKLMLCTQSPPQMGFEALLLGKEVHCFGMPFYAGWGATHDRLTCPREGKRRTAEEIFAAAYML